MKKELAKFFAGLTAWEAIVHAALAMCDKLPFEWCGFTITETINTVQIIIPASASIFLAWYAWFKKS